MKVLLYFQSPETIKTSGIGRAMRHQIEALTDAGVEYTLDPKDKYDLAHVNTLFDRSNSIVRYCKKHNIPVIVHGHSTREDFRDSFRLWKVMKIYFYHQLISLYSKADMIIAPTLYAKNLIDSYNLGTETCVISNGINVDEYAFKQESLDAFKEKFNIKEGEKVVIGIGYPFHRKGIEDFFEVARKFPDVKFIWFGHLQRILTQLRILKAIKNRPSNVIMPGYIDNAIIKGAMHYASCLFFPSREETEGIVVLEALASHCPVLIRDIGVYADWLTDGENCYKAENNEGFAVKIEYLLNNRDEKILENGYQLALERNLHNVGQELKKTYTYLIEKGPKNKR